MNSAHGRRFIRGKALQEDLQSVIVDTIILSEEVIMMSLRAFLKVYLERLGDRRYNVSSNVIKNIWLKFCQAGRLGPQIIIISKLQLKVDI